MYLEAVTVCVGFSDILAATMPFNKQVLDNWTIVTSKDDEDTKKLCSYYNIRCIETDEMYEDGHIFNKGKAINVGFEYFTLKGWCIHLDADILLPANLKSLLSYSDLETDCLYGIDRIDVVGRKELIDVILNLKNQYSDYVFVEELKPVSTRMFHNEMGYCPIGYLQMFHNSKLIPYPTRHETAARSDVLFLNNWAKNKRRLFPGCYVYHIKTEHGMMGKDWDGRKTIKL